MSTKLEDSEEESQTTELELRISLQVAEIAGSVGFEASFNNADSSLLTRAVFYMLDQAYKDKEAVRTLINVLPSMIEPYYAMAEASEAANTQQDIADKLKEESDDRERHEKESSSSI